MPGPEAHQHWGVLGGLFDPVHNGHLNLATGILLAAHLDGVLLIPSFAPPHREVGSAATFEQRVEMLKLAIESYRRLFVSEIEKDLASPTFTLQTLTSLKKRFPDTNFSFIIGADNLKPFTTWHRWREILRETRLLVGTRPGSEMTTPSEFPRDRVQLIEIEPVNVSSTSVRRAIAEGISQSDLANLVPPRIAAYIIEHGLYR